MIDNENRHYRKRHSGHLAVIVTILFAMPAFFLTMGRGELLDGIYFSEIPVHSLEVAVIPSILGFVMAFGLFGAVSMRCLNPDYGKVTLRKILILVLALVLSVGILLAGWNIADNQAECFTEDGLMAVNREEILVYEWDQVKSCRIEAEEGSRIMYLTMADGQEYVYGDSMSSISSDGFWERFPNEPEDYMKYVQRQCR